MKEFDLSALYCRYSSIKQEFGLSLEIQQNFGDMFIERYGLKLFKTYSDTKTSGYHKPLEKRTGITELLNDAAERKFSVVLTLTPDRLSRNVFELLAIRETLEKYNVELYYTMPGAVQPADQDIVSEMISYAEAMRESQRNGTRTRAASKLKVDKGEWPGGNLPFGFYLDPNTRKIEVVAGAEHLIRLIHSRYQRGESFEKIAATLDRNMSPTGRWTRWQVEYIVKNPIYAGKIVWNKRKSYSNSTWTDPSRWIVVESKHIPVVLDSDTWELSQEMLNYKKSTLLQNKHHYSSNYVLKDILQCSCGETMKTKNQTTKHKLPDGTKKTYGKQFYYCPDGCMRLVKDDVEIKVKSDLTEIVKYTPIKKITEIYERKLNKDLQQTQLSKAEFTQRLDFCIEKEQELKSQVSSLINDDTLNEEERNSSIECFRELLKANEAEVQRLREKSLVLDKKISACNILYKKGLSKCALEKFPQTLDELSNEQLKMILDNVYSSITLDNENLILEYALPGFKKKILYLSQQRLDF